MENESVALDIIKQLAFKEIEKSTVIIQGKTQNGMEIGSGVLIQVGEHYFAATASHVVKKIGSAEKILLVPHQDENIPHSLGRVVRLA